MKYYKLSGSSDPQIIGVNNGVHQGEIKWKEFKSKDSKKKIEDYFLGKLGKSLDKIDPIDFEIEYVEAYKKAKMTDFFKFTPALYGIDFFISDKVVALFKKFHMPVHEYIPVRIYHNCVAYNYYGIYIPQYYMKEALVIEKCVFNKGTILNKEFITFKTIKAYQDYKEHHLFAEKITFNRSVDTTLDLFRALFFGYSYLISEELKIAIDNSEITGITIQEPLRPEIFFD